MRQYEHVDQALNLFAPSDWITGADNEPGEFTPPVEVFPTFKKALAYFQDRAPGHAVQIDTAETHDEMIGSRPFKSVPGVVPEDVDGIKCYHDDDCVFLSISFMLPNGERRVATSAARPMTEEAFEGWNQILGADPVAFLAVLPDASRLATGRRLLTSAADAISSITGWDEITGMTKPILVRGLSDSAPLAALIYLKQRAQRGDQQAQAELAIMHGAAETPVGQKVAAPLLREASQRLAEAQAQRR